MGRRIRFGPADKRRGRPNARIVAPAAAWQADLSPAEKAFLDSCLGRLRPALRGLLHLSVYAQLSVPHLTEYLRRSVPAVRLQDVVLLLSECWRTVLPEIAGRMRL